MAFDGIDLAWDWTIEERMHNAHARKVFVMHITDAYSNESEKSLVSSFTRHICAIFSTLLAVAVFVGILSAEEGVQKPLQLISINGPRLIRAFRVSDCHMRRVKIDPSSTSYHMSFTSTCSTYRVYDFHLKHFYYILFWS
jgi:hypothetical protein